MRNEDDIASVRRERSVRLIGELELGQDLAALQAEVFGRKTSHFDYAEATLIRHRNAPSTVLPRVVGLRKRLTCAQKIAYKIVSNQRGPESKGVTSWILPSCGNSPALTSTRRRAGRWTSSVCRISATR